MANEVSPETPPVAHKPATNPLIGLITEATGLERVIYLMLIFIPLAFAAEFAGWDQTLIFFFSCLGITPLAKIMGTATEELAVKAGQGIGGLLNATFGNAVELIIAIFALLRAQEDPKLLDVVKASITGSIVGNLLFVLGLAIFVGGWKRNKQSFNETAKAFLVPLKKEADGSVIFPPYREHPWHMLAITRERVHLKRESKLAARVEGRSSLARIGIVVHLTAPTIHAGFGGKITLEMINFSPFYLKMVPNKTPICQLIVEMLASVPTIDINTKFQGQTIPSGEKK